MSNHLEITRIRDSIIQGVRDFKSGDIEASEVTNMLHNAYKDYLTYDKNFNYKIGAAYNITSFLKPGADFQNSLEELFAKYINTFVGTGALTLWQNGVRVDHDASFSVFNEKRMFYGSEFADADAKSNFIDNFEFHMFLQW